MAGNAIIAVCVALLARRGNEKIMLPVSMIAGSILKAAFMGISISLIILPNLLPEQMMPKLATLQYTFSFVQLFAALVGSVYAYIVLKVAARFIK